MVRGRKSVVKNVKRMYFTTLILVDALQTKRCNIRDGIDFGSPHLGCECESDACCVIGHELAQIFFIHPSDPSGGLWGK